MNAATEITAALTFTTAIEIDFVDAMDEGRSINPSDPDDLDDDGGIVRRSIKLFVCSVDGGFVTADATETAVNFFAELLFVNALDIAGVPECDCFA